MARGPAVKIILGDSERSELEMRARRQRLLGRCGASRDRAVGRRGHEQLRDRSHARPLPAELRGLMAKAVCQKALSMALMTSRAAARRARSVTRRSPKS